MKIKALVMHEKNGPYCMEDVELDEPKDNEVLVRNDSALLSITAREEDVGRLAARQALTILRDGIAPGDLPILSATDFAYVVNMDVARKLDKIPPFPFLQIAETVQH